MTPHFNQLNPAEAERLAILSDECAEVIQVIGKIQRHGYASTHPDGGPDNRHLLENELGDVMASMAMMKRAGDVNTKSIAVAGAVKLAKVGHFTHHQPPEIMQATLC